MTERNHWDCFNFDEILREAYARWNEARRNGQNEGYKDTLQYWTAWCAHANAASVFVDGEQGKET